MRLILYSKPGCHLCEGLQEKLEQILETQNLAVELEIRDITTREDWWLAYQYEVPVLVLADIQGAEAIAQPLPRPSPRASVQQIQQMLCKYLSNTKKMMQNKRKRSIWRGSHDEIARITSSSR